MVKAGNLQSMSEQVGMLLQEGGLPLSMQSDLVDHLQRISGHQPVIAIFGKTGAGKSSLGNALFGKETFKVGEIKSETREPKAILSSIFGVDMHLIDFPGVGESVDRDEEYKKLYYKWIDKIDLILWTVKIDDRAFAPDQEYFERVIKPSGFPLDQIIFAITQVDKANPINEWNDDSRQPGMRQRSQIEQKVEHVSELFGLDQAQVVPVSADKKYGLRKIAETAVRSCPGIAALNLARSLKPEFRTDAVKKSVAKAVWENVKQFYSNNQEVIHSLIINLVAELLVRGVKAGGREKTSKT